MNVACSASILALLASMFAGEVRIGARAEFIRGNGTKNDDNILGTYYDDVIRAFGGDDAVRALSGNDAVNGGNGDDLLWGSYGNDILKGGSGDDHLHGDSGGYRQNWVDKLYGGPGNDVINGDDGADRLYGGGGNDVITGLSSQRDNDFMKGGPGWDVLRGNAGKNTLYLGDGGDSPFSYHNSIRSANVAVPSLGADMIVMKKEPDPALPNRNVLILPDPQNEEGIFFGLGVKTVKNFRTSTDSVIIKARPTGIQAHGEYLTYDRLGTQYEWVRFVGANAAKILRDVTTFQYYHGDT